MKRKNYGTFALLSIVSRNILRCGTPTMAQSITIVFLGGILMTVPANAEPKEKTENLAHVGFLEFTNVKGSGDIAYLSGSISEALAKSMRGNFQYNAVDAKSMETGLQKIIEARKKNPQKKAGADKNTGVEFFPLELAELNMLAKDTRADILIFGQYESDAGNEAVTITTRIYFAATNTISDFSPEQHPINSSLFGAIDIMSTSVIGKITQAFAETTAGSDKEETATAEAPKKGEKIALTIDKIKQSSEKLNFLGKRNYGMFARILPVSGTNIPPGCNFAISNFFQTMIAWPCGDKVTFFNNYFVFENSEKIFEKVNGQTYFTIAHLNEIKEKTITTVRFFSKNPQKPTNIGVEFPELLQLPDQHTLVVYSTAPDQTIKFGVDDRDTSGYEFQASGTGKIFEVDNTESGKNNFYELASSVIPVSGANVKAECKYAYNTDLYSGEIVWRCGKQLTIFRDKFVQKNKDILYKIVDTQPQLELANLSKIRAPIITTVHFQSKKPALELNFGHYFWNKLMLPEQDTLVIYSSSPEEITFGTGSNYDGLSLVADGSTKTLEIKPGNKGFGEIIKITGVTAGVIGTGALFGNPFVGLLIIGGGVGIHSLGSAISPQKVILDSNFSRKTDYGLLTQTLPLFSTNALQGCNFVIIGTISKKTTWPCGDHVSYFTPEFVKDNKGKLFETAGEEKYFNANQVGEIKNPVKTTIHFKSKDPKKKMNVGIGFAETMDLEKESTLVVYSKSPDEKISYGIQGGTMGLSFVADGVTKTYELNGSSFGTSVTFLAIGVPLLAGGGALTYLSISLDYSPLLIVGLPALGGGIALTTLSLAIWPNAVLVEKKF